MKRRAALLLCSGVSLAGLGLSALPWLGTAAAAPRIGSHEGYTRLVFDLPGSSTVSSALSTGRGGNKVLTLTLQIPLKAEQGTLAEPGVASYTTEGNKVSLQLAAGVVSASASILPAGGGQPNRLIVDVPLPRTAAPKPTAAAPTTAAPRPSAPVIRPASTAKAAPLTVVLDAGHGGIDSGMTSRWVVEKEVTLDVALRVRAYLQSQGVNVIMVRTTDTQLSVNKKADLLARSRLATAASVNAYVAVHVNSGGSAASGIETYYFGQAMSGTNQSLAVRENGGGSVGEAITRQANNTAQGLVGDLLAQAKLAFSAQLARDIQNQLIARTGADDRGVKSDALVVIKSPHSPAILTEIGFGSSPDEGPKLAQAAYRDKVASAIARGILKFLKVN